MANRCEHITSTIDAGVATVRLDRPEKLNALTLPMLDALASTAHELADDQSLRAVVLTGAGESFCAGLDFATVMKDQAGIAKTFVPRPWRGTNTFQEACWGFRRIPVPVIAAVQGNCLGGGLQIAMGADFRITAPDARWSVLESRWGLIPDMSGVQALSEQVRLDVAKRLAMTGEMLDGEEAVRLGVATETSIDPLGRARELVEQLLTHSPDQLAAAKRVFDDTWHRSARRTFARERMEQLGLLLADNTRRAQQAAFGRTTADYAERKRGLLR